MTALISDDSAADEHSQELAERGKLVDALLARNSNRMPQDMGEGLKSLVEAIVTRMALDKKSMTKMEGQNDEGSKFSDLVSALINAAPGRTSEVTPPVQDYHSTPEWPANCDVVLRSVARLKSVGERNSSSRTKKADNTLTTQSLKMPIMSSTTRGKIPGFGKRADTALSVD
jgi:hypothetical protein